MFDKDHLESIGVGFNPNMHNTQLTLFTANYAYENGETTLLCGDSGAGKTTALKRYTSDKHDVLYISANPSCRTPRAVMTAILTKLHLKTTGKEIDLYNRLLEFFIDTEIRLIIVDEADNLNSRALQTLRHLNDETSIGIVFSGNDIIHHQMYGRGSLQYDQLRTRIGSRLKVTNIYTLEEIRNIFTDVDDECVKYLMQIATAESLRTAIKCYKVTYEYCKTQNVKISSKVLKTMQSQLFNGAM